MAPEPLLAVCAVGAFHLDSIPQCALVGNERTGIIDEEDKVITSRMGSIHLDIVVKFFRNQAAVFFIADVFRIHDEASGSRGEVLNGKSVA